MYKVLERTEEAITNRYLVIDITYNIRRTDVVSNLH